MVILIFYNPISSLLGLPPWPTKSIYFESDEAAFFILVFSILIIFTPLSITKLRRNKIYQFQLLSDNLIFEEDYISLFDLLERYLDQLIKIENNDFLLSKIKFSLSRWGNENSDSYLKLINKKDNPGTSIIQRISTSVIIQARKFAKLFSQSLPDFQETSTRSREVFQHIFTSSKTVVNMAQSKPYLPLIFLEKNIPYKKDLVENYLRALLNDKDSILYYEIKNTESITYDWLYEIPDNFKLLNFFFKDASVANNYGVWSPIGNEILDILDRLGRDTNHDPYNLPIEDFQSSGRWRSPLFVGIRFFGIMVSRALHQNINWHMWLYYYVHFTRKIVDNYQPHSSVDFELNEWPTKYSYLIYEMVNNLIKWIKAIKDLPDNQENIKLKSINCTHENSNIPKSSTLALVMSTEYCLLESSISSKYKQTIANLIFNCYFDLKRSKILTPYSDVLLNCITKKDIYLGNLSYVLLDYYDGFDWIPYMDEGIDDFQDALRSSV